jgi:L-seryl-tRNA(Ser) seleniumtransferase
MRLLQANRRSFLYSLCALPVLRAFSPASLQAAPTSDGSQARDVIKELGVRTFINAAGTYTALTGSLMPPEVFAAMQVASRKYVPLMDLHDAVGNRLAELLHCQAALVTAGCASAMSLGTAACVAGDNPERIRRLPDTRGMKDEVLIQRTHRVSYDHAVRNVGVRLIEVETREELERAIHGRTAMLFFLNTADRKGQIHHEEFVEIGKKHNVPTMIDAAADLPPVANLWRFTKMGFDLVAFSGGKGLRGPQSAGLLLGRKNLIDAAKLNNNPHADSLCRTNKVNKEEVVGMLVAVEWFLKQDHVAIWKEWEERCRRIAKALKSVKGVQTETFVPEIANAVPHLRVTWDYQGRGLSPSEMAERLRQGDPSIEVRPDAKECLELGVWMMEPGDDRIVGDRIREVLLSNSP